MTTVSQFTNLLQRRFDGDESAGQALRDKALAMPLEVLAREMLSGPAHLMLMARDVLAEAKRDELIAFLNQTLVSRDELTERRIQASWLLKDLCPQDSMAAICEVLNDPSADSSLQAAALDTAERLFFGGMATDENVREILATVGSSPDPLVQWRIVRLLGTSKLAWSIDCLERYVLGADEKIASEALRTLAEHRCGEARERFVRILSTVPDHLRDIAEMLRLQQDATNIRAQAELAVADGKLLQAKDVDALAGSKQYAFILQLLEAGKIDSTGLGVLSALSDNGELSKNHRKLIRRIMSIRDAWVLRKQDG